MKASEATPLNRDELQQLSGLLQRFILVEHPTEDGSSEFSDAVQTFMAIRCRIKEPAPDGSQPRVTDAPDGDESELSDNCWS